ncbi:MAG: enoyl-CoA hydratase-related protein [Dehalococcoidia bacterium]|nr:enoyl-CoA hydratase-related protein [Dehalococcoidia bacterium]
MSNEDVLLSATEDGICTLTINRPARRNALTSEVFARLRDALRSADQDGQTRVAVLRGAGELAFSAGYEIGQLPTSGQFGTEDPMEDIVSALESVRFPVIAMIHGYCVAAGLGIAVACDLRFASDGARLGVTPAKLGVVYPPSSMLRFINVIGVPATKELFYTGRLVDAARARELGLVNHVMPAEKLASYTYGVAREIADNAPLSVEGTKVTISKLLDYQRVDPSAKEELIALQKRAASSDDLKEGQRAFAEKRRPVFRGR